MTLRPGSERERWRDERECPNGRMTFHVCFVCLVGCCCLFGRCLFCLLFLLLLLFCLIII